MANLEMANIEAECNGAIGNSTEEKGENDAWKRVTLGFNRTYSRKWKARHAFREVFQNLFVFTCMLYKPQNANTPLGGMTLSTGSDLTKIIYLLRSAIPELITPQNSVMPIKNCWAL